MAIPPLRRGEEGFALITAVWLLVLCGAIGALVMLRSLSAAKTAKEQGDSLQHTILLESAVETVMAERMFGGPKSKWWALPASGSVAIGGHEVRVELTSEAGRVDLNEADPVTIDRALLGLGIDGQARAAIVGRIATMRAMKLRFGSDAEVQQLFASGDPALGCFAQYFTLASGSPTPRAGQMPPELARALGQSMGVVTMPQPPGTAVRIVAQRGGRGGLTVVARTIAGRGEGIVVTRWDRGAGLFNANHRPV